MRWMFQEETVALLAAHEGTLLWQDGLLQLFRYIEDNKAVCLCALKSVGCGHLNRFFETDIHAIIHRTVEQLGEEIDRTPEELIDFVDQMLGDNICGAKMRFGEVL